MGASPCTPTAGPHVVNQVFTIVTGWGYAARCGCGWKTPHGTHRDALTAGQRHMHSEHTPHAERSPLQLSAGAGTAA